MQGVLMGQLNVIGPQAEVSQPQLAAGLADLVNRLAQESAEARRALAMATQKLGTTSRNLEGRTLACGTHLNDKVFSWAN